MSSTLPLISLLLASLILSGCGFFSSFPNNGTIDAFFSSIDEGGRGQQNYRRTKAFLLSIRAPFTVEEDMVAEDALNRLSTHYLKMKDDVILLAVDETRIDGGFANMVCSFYSKVIQSEEATAYYRRQCNALRRCIGLSFSQEQVEKLCEE